jgi:hypothetical protein
MLPWKRGVIWVLLGTDEEKERDGIECSSSSSVARVNKNTALQSLADCKNVGFGFLASGSSEYRCVWDKIGIEALHETKGAIINGYAQDRHVVSVHHAVHEPDGLPARHHPRRPHHHLGEECRVPFPGYFGHVVANDVVR